MFKDWRVFRVPKRAGGRWLWPWVHLCVLDRECRADGCPRDVYVHPLRVVFRFGGGGSLEDFGREVGTT